MSLIFEIIPLDYAARVLCKLKCRKIISQQKQPSKMTSHELENTIHYMSKKCLDAWTWDNGTDIEECFPNSTLVNLACIWCSVNGFIGLVGNLLTIFAIPYAARRKK